MELMEALRCAFPFARRVSVLVPVEDDGSFVAEMVLPVRAGESTVQLYRFPATGLDDVDPEGMFRHEDRLTWHGTQRSGFGQGRWEFLASWDGVASAAEVRALVERNSSQHGPLGDTADPPTLRWASRPGRPGWPSRSATRTAATAAHDLLGALVRLPSRPGFATAALADLAADTAEAAGWRLTAHQVHAFAEVCVFTHPGSRLRAVLGVPIPMSGGRPSQRRPEDVSRPIPFDDLTADRRRDSIQDAVSDLRVGAVVDLARSYLPSFDDVEPEDPNDWAGLWRIRTGGLGPLVTLLDAADSAERDTVERFLSELGLAEQVRAYRAQGPPA
jgi:hypothetical protein